MAPQECSTTPPPKKSTTLSGNPMENMATLAGDEALMMKKKQHHLIKSANVNMKERENTPQFSIVHYHSIKGLHNMSDDCGFFLLNIQRCMIESIYLFPRGFSAKIL